jgi:hypothetical protein
MLSFFCHFCLCISLTFLALLTLHRVHIRKTEVGRAVVTCFRLSDYGEQAYPLEPAALLGSVCWNVQHQTRWPLPKLMSRHKPHPAPKCPDFTAPGGQPMNPARTLGRGRPGHCVSPCLCRTRQYVQDQLKGQECFWTTLAIRSLGSC